MAASFTAPVAGAQGRYWLDKGRRPVNVTVSLTGFREKFFIPGE